MHFDFWFVNVFGKNFISFLIIELFELFLIWFLVCLMSFALTFSNIVGYYKYSGEQKEKITNFLVERGQKDFSIFPKLGPNALSNNNQ